MRHHTRRTVSGLVALLGLTACPNPDVETRTFFEQRIAPVLDENCVRGTADNLCHVESEQVPGTALGNLDLSSFEAIKKRPELLTAQGSYPEPVLLLKAVKPEEVSLQYGGTTYQSEVFHAGGGILSRNSAAFLELQQWLKNGATIDGVPPEVEAPLPTGPCVETLRPDVEPFLGLATGASYDEYVSQVEPILEDRCSAGSCHGSSQSDFYLTCGNNEEQLRHNFVVAQSFVAPEASRSELLLRPLSPNAGGVNHSGGDIWGSASAGEYETMLAWAEKVGPLDPGDESPEFSYFEERVMPVLLKRGCAMPQCHSPEGFNDFRLRAGSRGFFSPLALRRNYEATREEFVSLDASDPNESRILKKNIAVDRDRLRHRAGTTLLDILGADDGGNPAVCPAGEDEQPTSYCTVVEWIRRERAAAVAEGRVSALAEGDTVPIIYVDRPANPDRVVDFATYHGDARLMRVDAVMQADGSLGGFPLQPTPVDLSACTAAADYDVRGPEISYDGTSMVFALRAGESDGLNVYESALDGSGCTQLTTDGGQSDSGVPIHNFDPVYVPDDPENNPGGAIVFASTRPGKLGRSHVSPKHRLPASNLWRMGPDGSGLEQMTFLNGSELSPAMMQNGQVTMTTEKATASFYQISGRRINWDLTDYHPLLAQRAETIGFEQATEIRESLDRNFLLIASNANARFQGGSLVTYNRSLGPFQESRVDEPGYVGAVDHMDPAAAQAGRGPANGAYRSPYPAPDGSVLVSYAAGNLDLTDAGANVDFDLVMFEPITDTRVAVVAGGDGRFQVEGVIGYARSSRRVFMNIPELVFGGTSVPEALANDSGWAHFPDLPMLATLLTSQDRGDRHLEDVIDGDTLAIYLAEPPPAGAQPGGATFESHKLVGTHALAEDGSAFVELPAGVPVIIELRDGDKPVLTMTEEHQLGPGELTSLGISRQFFDGVCGGCHGSVEGPELDVVVNPDALTSASISLSREGSDSRPEPL